MKCPVCRLELNISEGQGIEIGYCLQCKSIWLDLGILRKIVERSQPGCSNYRKRQGSSFCDKQGCDYAHGVNHWRDKFEKQQEAFFRAFCGDL